VPFQVALTLTETTIRATAGFTSSARFCSTVKRGAVWHDIVAKIITDKSATASFFTTHLRAELELIMRAGEWRN
jgi:hypothetical protein